MLIHLFGVKHVSGCIYEYHTPLGGNNAVITFTTKVGQIPTTGDTIENNQLRKVGDAKN